jgi:endonuclease/exonuclease/phosphatase family metal-dependent hydrolase
VRVVTFNLHFAHRLERALEIVRAEPALRGADVISLQEADDHAVAVLSEALEMDSAWYPAAIHRRTGRPFAPAVLSRWPIASHQRVDLPHPGLHRLPRVAVRSRVRGAEGEFEFVAIHFGTMREIRFSQQDSQARQVLAAVADVSGPLVIAGDLNRRGLGKLFEESGFRWITRDIGRTHHIWSFDHIFARGFPFGRAESGSVPATLAASDHRAVWAQFD